MFRRLFESSFGGLVTDKGDAILRQTPADLIGTPLLLRSGDLE